MSRRVTNRTEMTDLELVKASCDKLGVQYQVSGQRVMFLSGPLRNATLNLKTGEMSGDDDFGHTEEILGMLNQTYAELMVVAQLNLNGASVENVYTVDGVIEIDWQYTSAG